MRTYYIYGGTEQKRDSYVISRLGLDDEGYLDCDLIEFEDRRWLGVTCGTVCWLREFNHYQIPYREFFRLIDNHVRCFETTTGYILNNYSTVYITSDIPVSDIYFGMKTKYRSILLKKMKITKIN